MKPIKSTYAKWHKWLKISMSIKDLLESIWTSSYVCVLIKAISWGVDFIKTQINKPEMYKSNKTPTLKEVMREV